MTFVLQDGPHEGLGLILSSENLIVIRADFMFFEVQFLFKRAHECGGAVRISLDFSVTEHVNPQVQ